MWTLSGSREKMLSEIERHASDEAVVVKTKPSKRIFLALLERTKVKRIIVSGGIAATMPSRVFDGLTHAGVKVEVRKARAGRPAKFGGEIRSKVISTVSSGTPLAVVLKKFGVSRRSYFYWKKKKHEKPDGELRSEYVEKALKIGKQKPIMIGSIEKLRKRYQ